MLKSGRDRKLENGVFYIRLPDPCDFSEEGSWYWTVMRNIADVSYAKGFDWKQYELDNRKKTVDYYTQSAMSCEMMFEIDDFKIEDGIIKSKFVNYHGEEYWGETYPTISTESEEYSNCVEVFKERAKSLLKY